MMVDHEGGDDGDDGTTTGGSFPMPTLSSMQPGLRPQAQQQTSLLQQSNQRGGESVVAGAGGSSTLMLRSLLTGANVPVVASAGVVQGVVSQTSPVTLDPVTATDPSTPDGDDRAGENISSSLKRTQQRFISALSSNYRIVID